MRKCASEHLSEGHDPSSSEYCKVTYANAHPAQNVSTTSQCALWAFYPQATDALNPVCLCPFTFSFALRGLLSCYIKWKIPETNKSLNGKWDIILSSKMNFYIISFCFTQDKLSFCPEYPWLCSICYTTPLVIVSILVRLKCFYLSNSLFTS